MMGETYVEWMDGDGGYREWYAANVGDDSSTSKVGGAHTNGGDAGPPPPPPPKQPSN